MLFGYIGLSHKSLETFLLVWHVNLGSGFHILLYEPSVKDLLERQLFLSGHFTHSLNFFCSYVILQWLPQQLNISKYTKNSWCCMYCGHEWSFCGEMWNYGPLQFVHILTIETLTKNGDWITKCTWRKWPLSLEIPKTSQKEKSKRMQKLVWKEKLVTSESCISPIPNVETEELKSVPVLMVWVWRILDKHKHN